MTRNKNTGISIIDYAKQTNTPIIGEFELTANCNFKCSFCYLNHNFNQPLLDTNTWIRIFGEAYNAGMVFANLTGGEIFLRKDFNTLYSYLFDKGIKISLFTNGSLITDETLDLLSFKKPQYIATTLYGYDEKSYSLNTGNNNSFINVKRIIIKLKEHGINVILRTIPVKTIYNRLDNIINFVKSLDMKLYYFSYVTKGEIGKENERLSPRELIDFENRIKKAFNHKNQEVNDNENYKSCLALRASFFINHKGEMAPCALAYQPKKSILENDFLETFHELNKEFLELEKKNPCNGCKYLNHCHTCYARRLNEDGIENCSSYLKDIAEERYHLYKIGDLNIKLHMKYQEYFLDNLEKYRINNTNGKVYTISTHFENEIKLPEEEPAFTYSTRYVYQNELSESIYALDDTGKVKESFVRDLDYSNIDITIANDKEEVLKEKEYIYTGIAFLDIASNNGYVPIHGSAISHNGESIIFSAPSGVGKSTISKHWLNLFPNDINFNDDKPLIYLNDNVIKTSGSPWSGKDAINENMIVPLRTIVFLKQGDKNTINKLNSKQKIEYLFRNINRPKDETSWDKMMITINEIVEKIEMYEAEIVNDISAAKAIYNAIYGGA